MKTSVVLKVIDNVHNMYCSRWIYEKVVTHTHTYKHLNVSLALNYRHSPLFMASLFTDSLIPRWGFVTPSLRWMKIAYMWSVVLTMNYNI